MINLNRHEEDFGRGLATWYSQADPQKPRIIFLGANGHAISTYPFFINRLAERYAIESLEHRAVWPDSGVPQRPYLWEESVSDYAAFLAGRGVQDGELVHVGHSMGGTIGALLAVKRPELFKRLVIIEPGTVANRWQGNLLRLMSFERRKEKVPFIRGTLNRRNTFESREQFMQSMWTKQTYKGFSEEAMRDYAEGGLIERDGKFCLKYHPAWEAQNFCDTRCMWAELHKVKVPTLLIRAEHTNLQSKKDFLKVKKKCARYAPNIDFVELPGVSHMAIQDDPDLVCRAVFEWLEGS